MTVRARLLSTLVASLLIAVTGCAAAPSPAPAAPAVKSTPTPTPTPTAIPEEPIASVVVIGPDGFAVQAADGEEISFFRYDTDPALAIADLTRVFDAEPVVEQFPGDQVCEPERVEYAWPGMSIHIYNEAPWAGNFGASAEEEAPNSTITVQTEHGGQIGGSFVELVSGIPDALSETWDHEGERWDVAMDGLTAQPPSGEEAEFWPGVRIHAIEDEISNIYAPVSLKYDC